MITWEKTLVSLNQDHFPELHACSPLSCIPKKIVIVFIFLFSFFIHSAEFHPGLITAP